MKEFKGTKGKWYQTYSINKKRAVRTKGGLICVLNSPMLYTAQQERYEKELVEYKADQDLIASAPELLEALQNTLSTLKSMIGTMHGDWIQVQEAERVINKALGTSAGA